jgi:hypothetical protein
MQKSRRIALLYLRSDDRGYGVYSFVFGQPKRAGERELEINDLKAVATFAAELQDVAPSITGEDLSTAVGASFSLEQQLKAIDRRLRGFETFAGSLEAYDEVRDLCRELDLRVAITELSQRATVGLRRREWRSVLPRTEWCINTADLGPQTRVSDD